MRYILVTFGLIACLAFLIRVSAGAPNIPIEAITLNKTNYTLLLGEVNADSVNVVMNDITQSNPNKTFYLVIESPGGDVIEGRRLVSYLQTTDRKIVCIARTAISMAYVTLQACPVRLVMESSILMTHQIAGSASGPLRDITARLVYMQKLADLYDGLIAARMGLTVEDYRRKMIPEWWMVGPKDILDNKAADKEVKVVCTKELEKATKKIGNTTVSQCPVA